MSITIALAGNPNSGKTTVFNLLTGSTQHVGNWPGVTVEKKEGKLKGYKGVSIIDLPGIYSLSPYTLEEVVARNYLINEKPDVIVNIVDASNIERNLYLTTQLLELDIPVVVVLNMMDIIVKNGEKINIKKLSDQIGCPVIPISAITNQGNKGFQEYYLQGYKDQCEKICNNKGINVLAGVSVSMAKTINHTTINTVFSKEVESVISQIEDILSSLPSFKNMNNRWLAIKLFESDEKALISIDISKEILEKITILRDSCEKKLDDDAESIIIKERYESISRILNGTYKKNSTQKLSTSDKIDKIVTNKWLGLPMFFGIMWFIYWVSISTLGDYLIGWVEMFFEWISGGVESFLVSAGAVDWMQSLIIDGIIGGISGIMVFVPQLMILFLFISLLEDSGYMARVAFIMDKIFHKFGLSGKSFIPMLIGTGCSIPGIMASRTIENEKDRKMTIMLTPFIPCGAKLPVFAMFIAIMFSQQSWVGPSMYIIGFAMVVISGIILKRTKLFKGDPAPFVMELPQYRFPKANGVVIHMWEKAKSFIIKAGTIILIAVVVLWFLQSFSFSLEFLGGERIEESILAKIGNSIKWLFAPLGFGNDWTGPVALITGLIAKEVVVATFAIVGTSTTVEFTQVSAYAFMIFTLFAAPCFAAIGAMKREFGNWKWTFIAIGYQTGIAYILAMLVYNVGGLIFKGTDAVKPVIMDPDTIESASEGNVIIGDIVSIIFAAFIILAVVIGIVNKLRNSYNKKEK
ncbi:ferrous iron transport protein B [Mycoplasmatota bacterium]|nr:ferrous iron transport protein B [Mycoplasmatota bacterium]